jgi:hypothetical protein
MALEFDKEDLIYIKDTIDWMLENMDLKDVAKGSENLYNLSQNSLTAIERGLAQCSDESAALPLQSVTNRALLLKIKKLEADNKLLNFMVEYGLGEEDMMNDITYPHEL